MTDAISVEMKLIAVVNDWSLPIDPGCRQHLTQLIHDATVKTPGLASDQRKMEEAETNLTKLLAEMTWQAGAMGFSELHEPTFFAALSKLCPLFPFC